jgi:hypothetical protein
MRVADSLVLKSADDPRFGGRRPARIALLDDEREELDAIPLADLAAALAPFLRAIDEEDDK